MVLQGHLHYICVEATYLVVQTAVNKQLKETIEPNRVVGIGSQTPDLIQKLTVLKLH